MKNLILIVLVALCLVGCISLGPVFGQDLELDRLNQLNLQNDKAATEIKAIIRKSEGEVLIKCEGFGYDIFQRKGMSYKEVNIWEYSKLGDNRVVGGYYARKKDTYIYETPSLYSEHILYIDFEHWKMLPEIVQKEFKKWGE